MMVCHNHLCDTKLKPEKVKDFDVADAIHDCLDVLVTQEQLNKQEKILKTKHKAIFEPIPHADELPWDKVAEIHVKNAKKTIKSHLYLFPCKYKEAWQILIQQHLDAGQIHPSLSPCTSPVFIVPKANPMYYLNR